MQYFSMIQLLGPVATDMIILISWSKSIEKNPEFDSPGQIRGVKQFLLSLLNTNRHWFEECTFYICTLPVWQGCSRYQQVPSFPFSLFPVIYTGLSNFSCIIHFPQFLPHNLTQYHLTKDFGFVPFFFKILKFTSSLLFKHFPFCSFFGLCVHFWVY